MNEKTRGGCDMSEYKLVPVEPTPEMLEAGADWCGQGLGTYEAKGRAAAAYRFMLAAAPTVQGEPVAYAVFAKNGNIRIWSADPIQTETLLLEYGDQVRPLYATPKPVEQKPAPEVALLEAFDAGQRAAQAEAAVLVEALELIAESCDAGRHDGLSEESPALCATESWLIAKGALAAYRNQGGQS